MQDINVQVSNVRASYDPPQLTFSVTMDILSLEPAADSDGELFNQRFGQEILKQIIASLR